MKSLESGIFRYGVRFRTQLVGGSQRIGPTPWRAHRAAFERVGEPPEATNAPGKAASVTSPDAEEARCPILGGPSSGPGCALALHSTAQASNARSCKRNRRFWRRPFVLPAPKQRSLGTHATELAADAALLSDAVREPG
jgi:hypothetical protein